MLTKFQFHKGTIKTLVSDTCVPIDNINFNSIKVRLKHLIFCCTLFNIKYFNSIKVRLKLVIAIKVAIYALGYFNSIKVRLKRLEGLVLPPQLIYFNSIKVRLKHIEDVKVSPFRLYFNSIKVRLKQRSTPNKEGSIPISIP